MPNWVSCLPNIFFLRRIWRSSFCVPKLVCFVPNPVFCVPTSLFCVRIWAVCSRFDFVGPDIGRGSPFLANSPPLFRVQEPGVRQFRVAILGASLGRYWRLLFAAFGGRLWTVLGFSGPLWRLLSGLLGRFGAGPKSWVGMHAFGAYLGSMAIWRHIQCLHGRFPRPGPNSHVGMDLVSELRVRWLRG